MFDHTGYISETIKIHTYCVTEIHIDISNDVIAYDLEWPLKIIWATEYRFWGNISTYTTYSTYARMKLITTIESRPSATNYF